MNVKVLSPNLSVLDRVVSSDQTNASVKMENANKDRDANGRQDRPNQEGKLQLSDEEMELVLETLRNMEGIKANNLVVELINSGDRRAVLIKDLKGKVVRRIPESELWPLIQEKDKSKGQLFDKAG